jgi:hypothetical protein
MEVSVSAIYPEYSRFLRKSTRRHILGNSDHHNYCLEGDGQDRVCNSPQLIPILSQMNPLKIPTS